MSDESFISIKNLSKHFGNVRAVDEVSIDIGGPEYTKENQHFVNCIKNNDKPLIDVFQAVNVQSVVDSIYKTAKSGKVEEVNYIG